MKACKNEDHIWEPIPTPDFGLMGYPFKRCTVCGIVCPDDKLEVNEIITISKKEYEQLKEKIERLENTIEGMIAEAAGDDY